jgi:hypothetical protein
MIYWPIANSPGDCRGHSRFYDQPQQHPAVSLDVAGSSYCCLILALHKLPMFDERRSLSKRDFESSQHLVANKRDERFRQFGKPVITAIASPGLQPSRSQFVIFE